MAIDYERALDEQRRTIHVQRLAIEGVRALHEPIAADWDDDKSLCSHCRDGYGNATPYPCPTIRALEGS